jgi:hypothetical protein
MSLNGNSANSRSHEWHTVFSPSSGLPTVSQATLAAVRRLVPTASRAVGSAVTIVLPSTPAASRGARSLRVPGNGRVRALVLLRRLHGTIARGEAEADNAEATLFPDGAAESTHPQAHEAALTEVLAAEASHTASEAEAEALLGAALPINIRIMGGHRVLRSVTPTLVRSNARLVRGIRRSGPSGPQLLRTVPTIQRRTVASLNAIQRRGRTLAPSMVPPVMAAQAARVLGTPHIFGPTLVRNALIRHQTVARARRPRRCSCS